jgi:hypothetical protein
MQSRTVSMTLALAALLALAPAAHAVNFGDMFNPGRWFGGGNDDDYYYDGPYGPYGPGPYGPYGYGAPGYGPYGAPGYAPYGYPAAPQYAAPQAPAPQAPAPATSGTTTDSAKDAEIEALKRRIEQLESRQSPPSPAPAQSQGGEGWPSAPAFRPMDQY